MTSYDRFISKKILPSYVGLVSFRLLRKYMGNLREFLGKWFTVPPPRQKVARTRMEKYMTGLITKNYRVPWTRAFFCPVVCQAMKDNYLIWKICLDGNTAENSYCNSIKIYTFFSTKSSGSHFGDDRSYRNSMDSFGNIPSALLKAREETKKEYCLLTCCRALSGHLSFIIICQG